MSVTEDEATRIEAIIDQPGVFPFRDWDDNEGAIVNYAFGLFDIENHDFKLAIFLNYPSIVATNVWMDDPLDDSEEPFRIDPEDPAYPTDGFDLTGKIVVTDTTTGITTVSWDDVVMTSTVGSSYFTRTWIETEYIWGAIYDYTASNKPILYLFPILTHDHTQFLRNGNKHTITGIEVQL